MRCICAILTVILASWAPVVTALEAGTDVLVPAAARVNTLVTDLYIMNPGNATVTATLSWLVRNQANPNPLSSSFELLPGESVVLEDVLFEEFGLGSGAGAFRVVATGPVVVNSRIFNLQDGVSFGQGFEGVPASAAIGAGSAVSTDIVGLANNGSFRSNFYALAGAGGAVLDVSLRDAFGTEVAGRSYSLDPYEPVLKNVTHLGGVPNFDYGCLHVSVSSGSAVVGASKADNDPDTGDPTTLESWISRGAAASVDGSYRFALTDSFDFAAGGELVVVDGRVTEINTTYFNWDKIDATGAPECREVFLAQIELATPIDINEFEDGVVVEQSFESGGVLEFELSFSTTDNLEIEGSVSAVGSGFTLMRAGCNGEFPALALAGGKGE